MRVDDFADAQHLSSARLELEPLRTEHATEMAPLLDDVELHTFMGGEPATPEQLRDRYARQVTGRSPDGSQRWLNWLARHRDNGQAVGTTQATVSEQAGKLTAAASWHRDRRHALTVQRVPQAERATGRRQSTSERLAVAEIRRC